MDDKNKIWHLFARKLSGEANEKELSEFKKLLERKPEFQIYFEFFSRLWKHPNESNRTKVEYCYKALAERLLKDELKLISSNSIIIEKFKYKFCLN